MKYLLTLISIAGIITLQNEVGIYQNTSSSKWQLKDSTRSQFIDTSLVKDPAFMSFLRHFSRNSIPFSTIGDTLSETQQLDFYKRAQIPKNLVEKFLCNGNPQSMIVNKRNNIYYDFYYKYMFPSYGHFITLVYEKLDGEGGRDILTTFDLNGKMIDSTEIENQYTDETSSQSYFYKDGEIDGSVIKTSETFIKLSHKLDADTVQGFKITETLRIEHDGHIKKINHYRSGTINFKFVDQAKFKELDR